MFVFCTVCYLFNTNKIYRYFHYLQVWIFDPIISSFVYTPISRMQYTPGNMRVFRCGLIPTVFNTILHITVTSQKRHCVWNYRQLDCLFNSGLKPTKQKTPSSLLLARMWGEATIDRWFSSQTAGNAKSCACHDVIMTISISPLHSPDLHWHDIAYITSVTRAKYRSDWTHNIYSIYWCFRYFFQQQKCS